MRLVLSDVIYDKVTYIMHMILRLWFFKIRLEEIGASAAKEYSLEKALFKMKDDWKDLAFELTPYRDTVSWFLKENLFLFF